MAKSAATRTNEDLTVTQGSGNVFADLGLEDAEALQVKARLTSQVSNRIKALGLTQKEAVARLGIRQPDVSKLMHCKHTGFSSDRLLAFLVALDLDIAIVLRPCPEPVAAHRVRVHLRQPRRPRLQRVPGPSATVRRRTPGRKRASALAEHAVKDARTYCGDGRTYARRSKSHGL
jgi:predicted XRE-type DNA-binding protein